MLVHGPRDEHELADGPRHRRRQPRVRLRHVLLSRRWMRPILAKLLRLAATPNAVRKLESSTTQGSVNW